MTSSRSSNASGATSRTGGNDGTGAPVSGGTRRVHLAGDTADGRPFRVVHVIPYDGIGGVEAAARSMPAGRHGLILFEKCFLVRKAAPRDLPGEHHGRRRSENDPRAYLDALRWVMCRRPDAVVASLWRSCAVLLLVKLLRPRVQAVTFLHLASDSHLPDRLLNLLAMRVSSAIWADSEATLAARVPARLRGRARVISLRTATPGQGDARPPSPSFVFWGRLHAQKRVDRALRLFAAIRASAPGARFDIIGPDGGERPGLEAQMRDAGLEGAVRFLGPMDHEAIFAAARRHSFYLQTSDEEGLGMSVAEAMQLGLVPLVTPVGEIARYCRDGENAILVPRDEATGDGAVVERVLAALADPALYSRLSAAAADTWCERPLYRDDVLAACRDLAERVARGGRGAPPDLG